MTTEKISTRLQVAVQESIDGKQKMRSLSFGNIAAAATDTDLLSVGTKLAGLVDGALVRVTKTEVSELSM